MKKLFLFLTALAICSCSDDYKYDDSAPDFLGGSIYEQLQESGNFTTYLKLVDDLNYADVLRLTGSKTVFPADDEAFGRFFQDNIFGVASYEQLSYAQKRALLNSSMINMAYQTSMLSNAVLNTGDNQNAEGIAIRRASSYTFLDNIVKTTDPEQLSAPFFAEHKDEGLYMLDDETSPYIIHFTPQHVATNNIPLSDMSLILNTDYQADDIFINGVKVLNPNVVCKNGYIHQVAEVLTPNRNMSQIIAENGQTDKFSLLMNKFCAPYYSSDLSDQVHKLYDGTNPNYPLISEDIYVKRYFTTNNTTDPEGKDMSKYGLLTFDPSNNSYGGDMTNMGVMFVPTDQALDNYINSDAGRYLKEAYGSWENVPTDILSLFIKNHQKKSFMESLPNMWPTMNDDQSFAMHVNQDDVEKSIIASNGVVYVTNTVYPPIDYQSVYASVLTNPETKIMKWALTNDASDMKFYIYLRSMENMYNLIVPTDEALKNYRDPIAWAKGKSAREIWEFKYDETLTNPVTVDVYSVAEDGTKAEFKRTLEDSQTILNRLRDICDRHIVVGDKDDEGNMSGYLDEGGVIFAETKGGSTIRVAGEGLGVQFTGGGDVEQGVPMAQLTSDANTNKKQVYDSDNGRTFFIDRVLQDPINSVYANLGAHEEYSKFFELLGGNNQVFATFKNDPEIKDIFSLQVVGTTSGMGQVVSSFNNFRYTVFIPTNEAVDAAFAADPNLHTWDEIAEESNENTKHEWALHLIRFLKYHFMDNSVYVDGVEMTNSRFETAARNDNNRFQTLLVTNNGGNLSVTDANGNVANVIKKEGLYNLQSRDLIVNNKDYRSATQIISSSFSVIHLIDRALMPE